MSSLTSTLQVVRQRIARVERRAPNEPNARMTLIEPVLPVLGCDVEGVVREYRAKSRDKPVDHRRLALRAPKLFVEAKPLGENLDDWHWAGQIACYASMAGDEFHAIRSTSPETGPFVARGINHAL